MEQGFHSYVVGVEDSMLVREPKTNDEFYEWPTWRRRSSSLQKPPVVLWKLRNDVDTLTAELRDHGAEIGVELQFVWNGSLLHAWYFRTNDLALAEADDSRKRHEAQGWREVSSIRIDDFRIDDR
jgi:hypothetical protein